MHIKKILVPFDFSEYSDIALHVSTSLARDCRASPVILHVMEPFATYEIDPRYGEIIPYPDADSLKRLLQAIDPPDPKVRFEHRLVIGDPAKQIVVLVGQDQIDMIVMGTHGRTGLARLLTGSVAESVIRQTPCPVLTVKQPLTEAVRDSREQQETPSASPALNGTE